MDVYCFLKSLLLLYLKPTNNKHPKYCVVSGFKSSAASAEAVAHSPRKDGSGGCRCQKGY